MAEQKQAAESDFLSFVRMFWRVLEPEKPLIEGWVLDLLCDVMMAVTDGEMTRVCINVPPGSMKSSLLNCLWPAWEWGPQDMAHLRYLSVSYSTVVPERDNIRFARIINDPVYRRCWGDRVKLIREGSEVVENNRTGWKRVTSTGGSITGQRGDRLLLDDLNNPMNVESEDVRLSTTRFVREIMPDRLNDLDESAIINLQQRTHEEDATGILIKHGQGYEFVCVPMEFDPLRIFPVTLRRGDEGNAVDVWTDPRALDSQGRLLKGLGVNARGEPRIEFGSPMAAAEGTLCWPERFSEAACTALKAEKGPYAWSSQFNQFPGVRGGGIIRKDWWKLWQAEEYPELGTILVILDTAIEEGADNDFNACVVLGAFEGEEGEPLILLVDAWKQRMPLADLVERVALTCRRRKTDYLLIEHKTRGRDVHDEILRNYQDASWQTVLVPVEKSKISRLKAVSQLFSGDLRKDPKTGIETYEGGIVYAPDKEWAQAVIDETASFPYGAHDDYCFVAGTMIATRRGQVPIEQITLLDMILTPLGWRPVEACGMTGEAFVDSRLSLVGTPLHPIFTLDRCYQPLYTLTHKTRVARLSLCGLIQTILLSSSSSMASLIAGWEGPESITYRSQRRMRVAVEQRGCMSLCGSADRNRLFRPGMRSITRTATLSILILTTWSAYRRACIGAWLKRMVGVRRYWPISRTSDLSLPRGMPLKREANGTRMWPRSIWKNLGTLGILCARSVAAALSRAMPPDFVPTLARNATTGGSGILPLGRFSVMNVGRGLSPRSEPEPDFVPSLAETARASVNVAPVYNLTVADMSCYYANGILVHNCDCMSMGLGWVRRNGVVLRKVEYDAEQLERRKYRRQQGAPYGIQRR